MQSVVALLPNINKFNSFWDAAFTLRCSDYYNIIDFANYDYDNIAVNLKFQTADVDVNLSTEFAPNTEY